MPFKVKNIRKSWLRLYSTISRKPYFIRNNLVMGPRRPSTLGRTLWGYFNAPGNVMFVTTNVVSFAALVTYNTLVNIQNDRILQQEMLSAQLLSTSPSGETISFDENEPIDNIPTPVSMFQPLKGNTSFAQIKATIVKQIHERITSQKQVLSDEVTEAVDTPFTTYLDGTVELTKHVPINSTNSLIAKSSLFSLLYYYHLYEDIVCQDSKRSSNEQITEENQSRNRIWAKEVQRLRNLNFPIIKSLQNDRNSSLTIFYQIWNEENKKNLEKYDSIYQFKFPRWSLFPDSLSQLCNQLHDDRLETLNDFQRLYELTNRSSLKRLFRMWLYDYSNLLNRTNNNVMNEVVFNKLIKDSFNDQDLDSFEKFSSIILNPEDKRRKLFFTIRPDYQSYQIHLDTLLTIFQDYIFLQKAKKSQSLHSLQGYDMEILKMVQLIKNNGYLDKNGIAYILLRQDHPSFSESNRKRYFGNLSNNKQLRKLLQEVAILQKATSDS